MLSTISAFFLPWHGLRLVFSRGLRRFVMVPLVVNIVLFTGLAYLGVYYFETAMDSWLPTDGWLSYLRGLFWVLFALTYAVILFFGFTLLANLIAAPFNSLLAARVEERLTGRAPPADQTSLLRTAGPAIASEISKLIYLATRAIPLAILMVVPGVNIIASVGWLVFGAWFLAVEYGDYPMANHALRPAKQRARLRRHRFKALAFGAGVGIMILIPFMQFAVMPAAVAGATRLWVDDLQPSPAT
jgi:CysZ protein